MVTAESSRDRNAHRLVIEPNRSLGWRQSFVLILAVAVLLFSVATVFALKGYWMIFPFAGLEVAALMYCTYLVTRSTYRCQVVSIDEREVKVDKGRRRQFGARRQGPEETRVYPRPWASVRLEEQDSDWHPAHLSLGASGDRVELGEFLTNAEKRELAHRLRSMLSQ